LHLFVSKAYPEYEWLPWKFSQVPKEFWGDIQNQKNFVDWVGKKLKYNKKEDWYKLSKEVIFRRNSS
jgi:hypothetical protein